MTPNQALVAYGNVIKKITLSLFLVVACNAFAQVGVGTQTPMTTLDVSVGATPAALATGNGITVPSVTDASTTAVAGTNDGQMVYDTTQKAFYYWNAGTSAWTAVGGGSAWTYVDQATSIKVGESMLLSAGGSIALPATANDGDQVRFLVINGGAGFNPTGTFGTNTFLGDALQANGAVTYEWFNNAWWCVSF